MIGIEAGISFKQYQRALDFRISSLDFVLISHEHGDHAKAAKDLTKAGVDVYATRGTLDALGLSGHRVHALTQLEEAKVGPWRILPFPAVHDAVEPCGFLVGHGDYRLLYLSDSAFTPYRFTGLVEVAIEANFSVESLLERVEEGHVNSFQAARVIRSHLSLEECIRLLTSNDLSRCRAIHLLHLSSGNSDEAAFKEAVERATGIPTFVAGEGVRA